MIDKRLSALAVPALLLCSGTVLAHTGEGIAGNFACGFMHPLLGWDHVVAMVAVGLWGDFLGQPAIWVLPVVFPLVMAFGGALGVMGVPVPAVETGIATSALILGGMVALAATMLCLVYHLLNGIRHLVWDSGRALDLRSAYTGGWLVLIAAALLIALIFVFVPTEYFIDDSVETPWYIVPRADTGAAP